MPNRHMPRLCHACLAPMATQEDACWRCGATWAREPRVALRVIDGGTALGIESVAPGEQVGRLAAEARA
jgi:hypothetical protein